MQISVRPKLIYESKGAMGAAGAIISLSLGILSQQPWVPSDIAKVLAHGNTAALICGVVSFVGGVDRKDLFFRPSELRKAAEQAASNLTLTEVAETIEQGLKVAKAPAAEKPGLAVELLVNLQERLGVQDEALARQDQVLAEIKSVVTAHQLPPLADYPDRTDLPSDPRLRAQRQAPQMAAPPIPGFEPDVLQANSEGVLDGY